MEALKKAEQAKQSGEEPADAGEALRLEPIDSSIPPAESATEPAADAAAGRQLPHLPTQLEVLDAEFMAHAATAPDKPLSINKPPPQEAASPKPTPKAGAASPAAAAGRPVAPARPAAAVDGERKAAQQVFAAKQPERGRKGFAIAMGSMTVIALAAIGGYFWWQLQPKSGLATPGLALKPPPAPIAAIPAPPAVQPAPVAAAPVGAKPVDDGEDATPPRRAEPRPAPPPAAPESPIRVTKSRLKVNPALAQGFDALKAGDLAAAQEDYEKVLRSEPRNGDALHGLAAIALRQGNVARAEDYWLKALEADPKDALAQAALINSGGRGSADPLAQESRLKTLIAAQPEIAALHFALGNVFARQSRWNEAQQAYFKAFSVEPEHPDYVFNLAVSLDHLRQPRLAAQYYGQALAVAGQRPVGFDKAQVATRLRELQP